MSAFYRQEGDLYLASELTRGPWKTTQQHGGPPLALLVGAAERFGQDRDDWHLARVCAELRRPVPVGPVRVEVVEEHRGGIAQRLVARLYAGEQLAVEARILRLHHRPQAVPDPLPEAEPWPDPESLLPYALSFFPWSPAYPDGVELRLVHGAWGGTPIGFWTRPAVPLLEGRPTSTREALALLADAQSGMGVPLDPRTWTFVNPNVDLHFARPPRGPWIGFDIRSQADPSGMGLAHSRLRDRYGPVGVSVQSLVIAPRS